MPQNYDYEDDLAHDVRGAYQRIAKNGDRSGPAATLQKIARLFLKWDSGFSRSTTRARNAVKQLAAVPLDLNSGGEMLARSLREAINSAITEEADGERAEHEAVEMDDEASYPKGSDPIADFQRNMRVRSVFRAAIRTDADEADVKRITNALRQDAADSRDSASEEA